MDGASQDVFWMFIVPKATTTESNVEETIECNLQYASRKLSQVDLLNEVAPVTEVGPHGAYEETGDVSQSDSVKASYTSIMLAFIRLLVGYGQDSHYGDSSTAYTSFDITSVNWTTRGSAVEDLENLFRNITLSVLSVPDLT